MSTHSLDHEVEALFDAVGKWVAATNNSNGGLASGSSSTGGVSFSQRCLQSPPGSTAALLSTMDAFNEAASRALSLHSFYFGFTRRGKWRPGGRYTNTCIINELDSGKVQTRRKSESVDFKTQNNSGARPRQPPPPPPVPSLSLALTNDMLLTDSSGGSFSPQGPKPADKDRDHYNMYGGRSTDFSVVPPTANTPRAKGCGMSASSTDSPRRSSIVDSGGGGGGGGMAVPRSPRRHIDVTDPITGVLHVKHMMPNPSSGRGSRDRNSGPKGVGGDTAGAGTKTVLGIGMAAVDTFGHTVSGATHSKDPLSPSSGAHGGASHEGDNSKTSSSSVAKDGEVLHVGERWVTLEVPLLCLSRPLQWNEPFSTSREGVSGKATLAMLVQLVIESAAPILLTLTSSSFPSPTGGTGGSFDQGGISSPAQPMPYRLAVTLAKALQRLLLLPIGEMSVQQRTVVVPSAVAAVMSLPPQQHQGGGALGAERPSAHTLHNVRGNNASSSSSSSSRLSAASGYDDDETIAQPRPSLEYLLLPLPVPRRGGGGGVVTSPQQTTNTSAPHLNVLATIPFQLSDALYAAFRVVLAHEGLSAASYPSGGENQTAGRSKSDTTAASVGGESSVLTNQTTKGDPALRGLLPSVRSLSLFWSCCASASNSAITPLYAKRSAVVEGFGMALMSGVDVLRPLGELLWIGLERAVNDFESDIFGRSADGSKCGDDTIEDTSRGNLAQLHRSTNNANVAAGKAVIASSSPTPTAATAGIPSPPPRHHLSLSSASAATTGGGGGGGSPSVPIPPLPLPPYPFHVMRAPLHSYNTFMCHASGGTKASTTTVSSPSHPSEDHSLILPSRQQALPPVPVTVTVPVVALSLFPSQVAATYSWTAVAMGALSALQVLCAESSIARRGVRDTKIDVPLPLMTFWTRHGREMTIPSGEEGKDSYTAYKAAALQDGDAAEDDGERDVAVQRKRKQKVSTPLSIISDYALRLAVVGRGGGGGRGPLLGLNDASSPYYFTVGSSCLPLLLRLTSCLQVLTRDLDTCRWLCCDPASGGPSPPSLFSFGHYRSERQQQQQLPLADANTNTNTMSLLGYHGKGKGSSGTNTTCLNTLLYLISTVGSVGGECSDLADDRASSGGGVGEGVRLRVASLLLTSVAGVLQNMARDPESAAKLRKSCVVEVLLENMLLRPLGKGGEGEGEGIKKGSQRRVVAEGTTGTKGTIIAEAAGHSREETLKKNEEGRAEEEVMTNKEEDLLSDYVCEMQVAAIKVILNLHEGDAASRAQLKSLLSLAVAEYHLQDVFLC